MVIVEGILVSKVILQKKFICDLQRCKGACCWKGDFGAPLEREEIAFLNQYADDLQSFMLPEAWDLLQQAGGSTYYQEPKINGTSLMPNGACIYMTYNKDGIAQCGIEKANETGEIPFQKPISCHLYPIRVNTNSYNGFTSLEYDDWEICSPACRLGRKMEMPVYKFLKEATTRKFGEIFYEALDHTARTI